MKVAINGFGRMGWSILRQLIENGEGLEVVAVNDNSQSEHSHEALAELFVAAAMRGSTATVRWAGDHLVANGSEIIILKEQNPFTLPWDVFEVDVVVETTTRHASRQKCTNHLACGAGVVVATHFVEDADVTLVAGVNDAAYRADAQVVISMGSPTLHCLATVAQVVHERFIILGGHVVDLHALGDDQKQLDSDHPTEVLLGRAAALNLIPTADSATLHIGAVIPGLTGVLSGSSVRVPVHGVSRLTLVAHVEQRVNVGAVNKALRLPNGVMGRHLRYTTEALASSDLLGDTNSAIVDSPNTMVVRDRLVSVSAWYDAEAAYAARVVDLLQYIRTHRSS